MSAENLKLHELISIGKNASIQLQNETEKSLNRKIESLQTELFYKNEEIKSMAFITNSLPGRTIIQKEPTIDALDLSLLKESLPTVRNIPKQTHSKVNKS